MKAKIRGTEIYFDTIGSQIRIVKNKLIEKPIIFLIHGGPGGNHVWFRNDLQKLSEHAQLVLIDQRGCGLSKKDKASNYTLENNIEDIEALRKYLGLEKIGVIGVSYGGMVAQGYAIRYSKHIDKLILVVTAPSYHFIETARENLKKVGSKKQIDVCEKFLWNGKFRNNRDVNHYLKLMESLYIYNHKTKKRKKLDCKNLKSGKIENVISYKVLNAGFRGFLHKFNFISKLKKIKCPTLVLAGKYDWICLPEHSKIIAENIPDARLKVFDKCGHTMAVDAKETYIKAVIGFLKK